MKSNTIIFVFVLMALTVIRGCRVEFSFDGVPLARLTASVGPEVEVLSMTGSDDSDCWRHASEFVSELQLTTGTGTPGGPQFAKLPIRRVMRPNDIPAVATGWVSLECRSTKSLQRLETAPPLRGPPVA